MKELEKALFLKEGASLPYVAAVWAIIGVVSLKVATR